jgi:hypothetical protein
MTAFEVVFILVTIIVSLAITHLLSGFVGLLRSVSRVRFSALHALWVWIAFAGLIANWASLWPMKSVTAWPAWAVLLLLVTFIVQYVFCALVTPDLPTEGRIDLVAFHESQSRRYILAYIALLLAALMPNLALGGAAFYSEWSRDTALATAMLVFALLALFVTVRWLSIGAAVANAALNTYFMIIACNVVAA